ncbi:unnamed protein product [Vitrella brassicaformis CCMP3155]|uniref:HotDog ACOT-type domain-containing protein n=2 Tax=Vitrella brassicaformis TaxID=1169539 RepID=A0A0G4FMR2_VITBC|nr:unnamed protein product [Vitrella brassicaformis CCMP3155]|eukprot:CEM15433.1 unnamed protein product [Vitrella brassicaformis CCMP3155]
MYGRLLPTTHRLCRIASRCYSSSHAPPVPRPANALTTTDKSTIQAVIPLTRETVIRSDSVEGFVVSYAPPSEEAGGAEGKSVYSSWLEVIYPFKTNAALREEYIRADKEAIRYGRMFETLDTIAADSAYRHALGGYREDTPISIVTACIDSFYLARDPSIHADLRLTSYVTHVGKTSLEVSGHIYEEDDYVGRAMFVFVALDAKTAKPTQLPPLSCEQASCLEAEQRNAHRKRLSRQTLMRSPPRPEEMEILHALWQNSISFEQIKSDAGDTMLADPVFWGDLRRGVAMASTRLESTLLMQPTHRNVHCKMFGGYIARLAFELSWLTVQCLMKSRDIIFRGVDNIFFLKPVEVGAMVQYVARSIFTAPDEMQVQVDAYQVDPTTGVRDRSNVFHFHYEPVDAPPPTIVPRDYEEFMLYLEGRRRYLRRKQDMTLANSI